MGIPVVLSDRLYDNTNAEGFLLFIKKGSLGSGAKWVQWQLNRHGASLVVDGNFGKASVTALIEFQRKSGLIADGICGSATRAVLKL